MLNDNYININKECSECQEFALVYDKHHDVIFCTNCGLVEKDNTPQSMLALMEDKTKSLHDLVICNYRFGQVRHNNVWFNKSLLIFLSWWL